MCIVTLFVIVQTRKNSQALLWRVIKQTDTHPYHGILLGNKMEQTLTQSNGLDKSQENYAESKKSIQMLSDCILCSILKMTKV